MTKYILSLAFIITSFLSPFDTHAKIWYVDINASGANSGASWGNVSEMVKDKNKCKGGNWNSPQYELLIKSQTINTGSNPTIGFRVFMEVLAE